MVWELLRYLLLSSAEIAFRVSTHKEYTGEKGERRISNAEERSYDDSSLKELEGY